MTYAPVITPEHSSPVAHGRWVVRIDSAIVVNGRSCRLTVLHARPIVRLRRIPLPRAALLLRAAVRALDTSLAAHSNDPGSTLFLNSRRPGVHHFLTCHCQHTSRMFLTYAVAVLRYVYSCGPCTVAGATIGDAAALGCLRRRHRRTRYAACYDSRTLLASQQTVF